VLRLNDARGEKRWRVLDWHLIPALRHGPYCPRKRKVNELKIGTRIFEGVLGVRGPTGLAMLGVG
jgi:hypothetical protein